MKPTILASTRPRPDWFLKEINQYGQVLEHKINDKDIVLESLFLTEYLADLHSESGTRCNALKAEYITELEKEGKLLRDAFRTQELGIWMGSRFTFADFVSELS
ncbi:hypothetical protein BGZ98_009368 [Dissophora globulifera]|nr:hypothetical protein BGZ98_009368 [Dissophora globulifera]